MRYGIVWPTKITPSNYHEELPRHIGTIVDEASVSPSIDMENHWVVVVGKSPIMDDMDDIIVLHDDCLVMIADCVCYLQVFMNHGCCCGGFKSEQKFKARQKKP
jgi:hypothetical protein